MDPILELRKEHHEMEELLIALDELIEEKKFDIIRIKELFNELFIMIHAHEEKEDALFPKISKFSKDMEDSLDEINSVHKTIKGHIIVLKNALDSKDMNFVKNAMENDGRMLFAKLREHMRTEEKIFDSVLFLKPPILN